MSSVVISGDTSGTVTVSVPAVAGTNTVTIAAQSGTLNVAAPLIKADSAGTQTVSNVTITKITLVESIDTNNCFTSSTFTPNVAGYYLVSGQVAISAGTSITNVSAYIYKNGASMDASVGAPISATTAYAGLTTVVYMNGTTDTLELYGRGNGLGTLTLNVASFITASLIRGA